MANIQPLSNLLISQIAAGEVIERPASVIKELVENAIDAHATAINIQLIEGGLNSIIIQDNGDGVAHEQLLLAVTRHATSKIKIFEDLTHINSFGFRGEALAAVSAVSRFRLTSKTAIQSDYYSIDNYENTDHVNWNIQINDTPLFDLSNNKSGTLIEIEDLFHQVPVRKRFLKTASTEQKQVLETIKHFALQHPHISFQLTTTDPTIAPHLKKSRKILLDVMATTNWQKRLEEVLGQGQFFESSSDHLSLTAWILEPTNSTNHQLFQFLFVNGRYVKDRGLQQAVRVAWQDSLHQLGNPAYALFLTLPHEEIDVNVHPAKTEIRFRHGQIVYNWVRQTMRQALRTPLIIHEQQKNEVQNDINNDLKNEGVNTFNFAFNQPEKKHSFNNSNNFFDKNSSPNSNPTQQAGKLITSYNSKESNQSHNNWVHLIQKNEEHQQQQNQQAFIDDSSNSSHSPDSLTKSSFSLGQAIAQLHKTYILAENDHGLIVIDMHAAHERILLEQSRTYNEKSPSQQLLIPIIIDIPEKLQYDYSSLIAVQNYWQSIGIHVIINHEKHHQELQQTQQAQQLTITHLPNWCHYNEKLEQDIFLNAIEHFLECGVSYELMEQFEEKMANWHCHRAIRHGDSLTIEEMNDLLRLIEITPAANRCNHGRPTWCEITLNEINNWFLRGK
jgi:DNA mismatch repair protein MutL